MSYQFPVSSSWDISRAAAKLLSLTATSGLSSKTMYNPIFFNLFLISILSCDNNSKLCLESVYKGISFLLLLIGHLAPSLKVLNSPHYEKTVKNQGIFIIFFTIHSYSSFLASSSSSTDLYVILQCKIILIKC